MSWKEKMDEWGGGEVSFLSEDGEAIVFIIVGEPVLFEGKFKNRVSQRIGCPVITSEGYSLFIVGKRLGRRIARYEKDFDTKALLAVRRGEHNDIETTYELCVCPDAELTHRLFDYKETEFDETAVAESIKAAEDIVKG